MTDYSELVKALRETATFTQTNGTLSKRECALENLAYDAAAAIEALQTELLRIYKQLPKRGEWELIDGAEPMRWGCSRCKYLSWETSNYCPRCGAKMEVQE